MTVTLLQLRFYHNFAHFSTAHVAYPQCPWVGHEETLAENKKYELESWMTSSREGKYNIDSFVKVVY